ncbi:uncharacterized protein LOC108153050 [Drosophila miranda]|uniref:uncharacterized protein LOC108153050 n=1 Tax=Drosophila miranda TaxID=7229 RepID=UPI0007E7647D|nr:uncharacterized protein LOC108153050 [Drosophila miranda]
MDLVPENSSSANKRTTAGGRVKWSAALESLLIDIWQEKIEDLRGPRKNSHVYMEMAESMKEAGLELGWGEIRKKLENMTKKYRIEKNKIGPSGGAPSGWQHHFWGATG